VTRQEALEAALAKAESALGYAITNATKAGANLTDANTKIEKARTYCRQAHAALINHKRAEPTV
jgi:hypothetical protein